MSSRHRNLEPLRRWHATIYIMAINVFISGNVFASSTSPHMWLADGDSLMCYIVRMSRLIA